MVDIKKICLDIRGTVTEMTAANPPAPLKIVYQATSAQFANYLTASGKPRMRRIWVNSPNNKSPAQLNQQAKLTAAVLAWQALPISDRVQFKPLASKKRISVYMAFCSQFIKSYIPPIVGTIWDTGATTWDTGATTWDI